MSGGELPSGHLLLEQEIQFLIGAALGLWQAEKRPGKHSEGGGAPEEGRLTLGVLGGGIHKVRL
jgi:hypothetical protein